MKGVRRWIGIGVVAIVMAACKFVSPSELKQMMGEESLHGQATNCETGTYNPSESELKRVIIPHGTPEQIKEYTGFTVSFNPERRIPNYSVWALTADEARSVQHSRYNKFWQDKDIHNCPTSADYRNTGYDRGHMAPAGDMKWSREAMEDCFSMANMCPQSHTLNSGSWGKLEEKCRQRALADSLVVVVCGPVPEQPIAHIGQNMVEVPARFFKVILSPYTNPPKAIGFIMPNGYVEGGIQEAAVTVDSVEALTGYDFFSALPDELENAIEAKCNFPQWSRSK